MDEYPLDAESISSLLTTILQRMARDITIRIPGKIASIPTSALEPQNKLRIELITMCAFVSRAAVEMSTRSAPGGTTRCARSGVWTSAFRPSRHHRARFVFRIRSVVIRCSRIRPSDADGLAGRASQGLPARILRGIVEFIRSSGRGSYRFLKSTQGVARPWWGLLWLILRADAGGIGTSE